MSRTVQGSAEQCTLQLLCKTSRFMQDQNPKKGSLKSHLMGQRFQQHAKGACPGCQVSPQQANQQGIPPARCAWLQSFPLEQLLFSHMQATQVQTNGSPAPSFVAAGYVILPFLLYDCAGVVADPCLRACGCTPWQLALKGWASLAGGQVIWA